MKKYIPLFVCFCSILFACQKKVDNANKINYFENITFSAYNYGDDNQYFSTTDTFFKSPMSRYNIDSAHMANVDIVYIYDYDETAPGFMDPTTAAKIWYWNSDIYYFPWLSKSIQTTFYITSLNIDSFNAAKQNPDLLDRYFNSPNLIAAPNGIFPAGSCLGGRIYNQLKMGEVFGFKTVKTGKRGLLYIRTDQEYAWPEPITSFRTKVDIIKEK